MRRSAAAAAAAASAAARRRAPLRRAAAAEAARASSTWGRGTVAVGSSGGSGAALRARRRSAAVPAGGGALQLRNYLRSRQRQRDARVLRAAHHAHVGHLGLGAAELRAGAHARRQRGAGIHGAVVLPAQRHAQLRRAQVLRVVPAGVRAHRGGRLPLAVGARLLKVDGGHLRAAVARVVAAELQVRAGRVAPDTDGPGQEARAGVQVALLRAPCVFDRHFERGQLVAGDEERVGRQRAREAAVARAHLADAARHGVVALAHGQIAVGVAAVGAHVVARVLSKRGREHGQEQGCEQLHDEWAG
ncbi:hypothetical protein FGB62_136g015 [Gracilaria domingensis]|nr:hypothetical protein FGB62_136g015 [Gracilaria domingensis]